MAPSVSSFAELLQSAVTEPGSISAAYSQFHTYSIGNQLLAWSQCLQRGIQPGPMATFPRWKELGRYVRKGEKAITLCQPVTIRRTSETGTMCRCPGTTRSRCAGSARRWRARPWIISR